MQANHTVSEAEDIPPAIAYHLAAAKVAHSDTAAAVDSLIAVGADPMLIDRWKKRKLKFKDEIAAIEANLRPSPEQRRAQLRVVVN